MKRFLIVLCLVISLISVYANAAEYTTTSGEISNDTLLATGTSFLFKLHVKSYGASDAVAVVYDNITNSGKKLRTLTAPASDTDGVTETWSPGAAALIGLYVTISNGYCIVEYQPVGGSGGGSGGASSSTKLDDLAAPDDNTDLNATTLAHGLMPKLSGSASEAFRGDGTWARVAEADGDTYSGTHDFSAATVRLGPFAALYTDTNGDVQEYALDDNDGEIVVIADDGESISSIPTVKNKEPVAWTVYDSDTDVATITGKQAYTVPLTMDGYALVDVTVSCKTVGSGTVTVNILKDATTMMSTGLTLENERWTDIASDGSAVIKTDGTELVATGDQVYYDISVSGTAPKGLSITATFQAQ